MKVFIDKDGNYTNKTSSQQYSIDEMQKIQDKIYEAKNRNSVLLDTLRDSVQQNKDMIAANDRVNETYEAYKKAKTDYQNLKDSLFTVLMHETTNEINSLERMYSTMESSVIENNCVDLSPYEIIDKIFNKDEVSIYIMPDVCLATVWLRQAYVSTFMNLISDIVNSANRSGNICTTNRELYNVMSNMYYMSNYIVTFTSSTVNGKLSIVIKNKDIYSNPYDKSSDKLNIVAFIWREKGDEHFGRTASKPIPIFYNSAKKKYKLGYPGETIGIEVLQHMSGDKFWFNPLRDQSEIQEVQKFLMSYTIKNQ